jgi:hypothetical protein
MKHTQILKRAWTILWSYRTLWIFGFLLALTTGGSSGGSYSRGGGGSSGGSGNLPGDMQQALNQLNEALRNIPAQTEQTIIAVIIGLVCLGFLFGIAFAIVKYVSQVALVRMVDHLETTGEKLPFRRGWRMGWSRAAWRVFLINLTIGVPVFLAVIVMVGCAATPVLIPALANQTPSVPSIIATVGMAFLVIFALIVVSLALALVLEIMYRVSILQERGVLDSIREGWTLVRRNLKDVGLLWLILLGIRIAFGIVIIPVAIIFVIIAGLLGGGTGLGLFLLARVVMSAAPVWEPVVVGALVGVPIFILALAIPMTFVEGLKQTYFSTTWTLAYREIRASLQPAGLEPVVVEPAGPEPELPAGAEVVPTPEPES